MCARMDKDIADYTKDVKLTEPSDGKYYEWLKMADTVRGLSRSLQGKNQKERME